MIFGIDFVGNKISILSLRIMSTITIKETIEKVVRFKELTDAIRYKEQEERERKKNEMRKRIAEITPRAMALMDMVFALKKAGVKDMARFFNSNNGIYIGHYGAWAGVIFSARPYMGEKGVVFAIVRQRSALGEYSTYNEYDYIKDAGIFIEKYEVFEKEVLECINRITDDFINKETKKRYVIEYKGKTEVVATDKQSALKQAEVLGYPKECVISCSVIE